MDESKQKFMSREDLYRLVNDNRDKKVIKKRKKINQTL